MTEIRTTCAIAGGGPAGMMLALLLARAGVAVVILEKHPDFLRDFRGDTIHPSTLEVIYELGLLDQFLALPHQTVERLGGRFGDTAVHIADFSHVPTHCKFIALMPQWDFLDFLAAQGKRYAGFDLRMRAEATGLIEENGRIVGLRATTPDGELLIRSALTVGADGRHSTVRERAGLQIDDIGAPIDVLWLRLSKKPHEADAPLGTVGAGKILVMLDRGDYWQCAYVIPKGAAETVKAAGLDAFRAAIAELAPGLRDSVHEIASWDDVKLLTVKIDRLKTWHRPGLLCIGDAAHAMSPVGGVGINLAIQDAVATANHLAAPLRTGSVTDAALAAVQRRRSFPTRATQWLQIMMQETVLKRALTSAEIPTPPLAMRLLSRYPVLRRIPARLIGVGVRPEHVQTPDASTARA